MQRVHTLRAADDRCTSASASALRIRSAPRTRAGGPQKNKTLSHAYRSAPRVQPTAKAKTLIVIWVSRSLLAYVFSGANPCITSPRSIIIWVVLPVMIVDGGALAR